VINLINQGTSPIFQEQNGLPPAVRMVEIGEKCRNINEADSTPGFVLLPHFTLPPSL
jgi:hypothetical protein